MNQTERTTRMRQAILKAAERVFDAQGYAAATMEAIAEAAGVSKGSLYNYFESKRDLFHQLFLAAVAGEGEELQGQLKQGLTPSEQVEHLVNFWFQRMGYYRRIGRLFLEFWATAARGEQEGPLAATLRETYARHQQFVRDIVADGVRCGQFNPQTDIQAAAALILAILDGLMVQSILNVGVTVDEAILSALKRAILAGLRTPPGPHLPRVSQ